MADRQKLDAIRQGADVWNRWRIEHQELIPDLRRADLSKANLSGADLSGVYLRGANLSEANLSEADLSGADFKSANLEGAYLIRADLREANLIRADLAGANLDGADLSRANLRATNLSRANLSRAELYETVFGDTNLREAQGLDTCVHAGPSILDHRTLVKSGHLPVGFLRGCGLPDKLIEYLPSLLEEAIQFYSCFISYSTDDQPFAERLHADLQNRGVRCWFAPHNIQGGKKVHEQIDDAIRLYDRLLLIVSDHSMKSRWVKTEIANARRKEQVHGRQVLFPIRLVDFEAIRLWKLFDADVGDDSAGEIREYFIPDFSSWKNFDSYEKAFERLLSDLKAETGP